MLAYKIGHEPNKSQVTQSMFVRYIVAVVAAWTAEVVTYPFDLTKTRLQVQTEVASAKAGFKIEKRGMIQTTLHIVRHEGPFKLWSGMMAMCQRHAIYSGCRVVFYERLRNFYKDESGNVSILATTFCGMTAGAFAQMIASPTDLAKIRMQNEGRMALQGKPARNLTTIQVYKTIYKESGILGFWRGVVPNVQRASLTTLGTVAGYDYSKQFLIRKFNMSEGVALHTSAAFASGLLSAVLSTPADVMKTRLMNQPVGKDGKGTIYTGYMDCVRQSIKNEGILYMYKGFIPIWIRLGPWGLVNWLAFENILRVVGGKAF